MIPIIKTFNSKRDFPAVSYNLAKVNSGTADLLVSKNFGLLQGFTKLKSSDYENYLGSLSSLNDRTKSDQYHVMISAWKRTMSAAELKELGVKFMEEVGYADQPFLIVFHKDSPHNHIHLVSSHIRIDGSQITPSYIQLRGLRALHKIIGFDRQAQFRNDFKTILSYRFSDLDQLAILLAQKGYKGYYKQGKFVISKYGESLFEFERKKMAEHVLDGTPKQRQLNGYRELIVESQQANLSTPFAKRHPSPDSFKDNIVGFGSALSDYLLSNHRLEIIYHFSKARVDGFTLIDHKREEVISGELVMPLPQLVSPLQSIVEHRAPRLGR